MNTLFIFIKPLRDYCVPFRIFGFTSMLSALDLVALFIILVLALMLIFTMLGDLREYDKMDPKSW